MIFPVISFHSTSVKKNYVENCVRGALFGDWWIFGWYVWKTLHIGLFLYLELNCNDWNRRLWRLWQQCLATYYHHALWYGKYSTAGWAAAQRRHERAVKCTKDVNIFEKYFLIVPFNKTKYWFLSIVYYAFHHLKSLFLAIQCQSKRQSNSIDPVIRDQSNCKWYDFCFLFCFI